MSSPRVPSDQSGSPLATEEFLSSAAVRARSHVSDMWLSRRLASDPEFPKPVYLTSGRRFWALSSLITWERLRASTPNPRQVPRGIARREEVA